MTKVVPAEGATLERVLAATYPLWNLGLSRHAYGQWDAAQTKTAWGRRCRRRFALTEGTALLACATRYGFAGMIDERPVHICGVGEVFTDPHRESVHAHTLVERLLDEAARDGADFALLFSKMDQEWCDRNGFETIPASEVEIAVARSARGGAPMTLIRAGEERDLSAIAAMGQVRAAPFRFHLDRDVELVQHAITRKRLLAGLGPAGVHQLQFFIAEEGITAAAYLVLSVTREAWTIEECGDRDPSGGRVGAILQALIAREPVERCPSIRGWLPPGFKPPQITIELATPSTDVLMGRALGSRAVPLGLAGADVLYWRSDLG